MREELSERLGLSEARVQVIVVVGDIAVIVVGDVAAVWSYMLLLLLLL